MDLVDLGVIGQPTEDIDIPLVDAACSLRSLHAETAQREPLSILDTVNLSFLQVAVLLAISTHREYHLPALIVNKTMT